MKTERFCMFAVVALLVATDVREMSAQSETARQYDADRSQSWKAMARLAIGTKDAIDQSQQALETIEGIRSLKILPVQTALPTAEAAFLLGAPAKAIAIMERVIHDYPNEKMPGVTFPLDVVGNLWIGTFARYAGSPARAEAAYRDALSRLKTHSNIKGPSVLAAICYLYLAEIESQFHNDPGKAAVFLRQLPSLPKTKDTQGDLVLNVYQAWGKHMLHSLDPQTHDGTANLDVPPPYGDPIFVPTLHMTVVGLGDAGNLTPISAAARGKPPTDVFAFSLERVLSSKASPIDTDIALLLLGVHYELDKKDFAKARRYYGKLFDGVSYFSPEGGLAAAQCWKRENKLNEAKQMLEDVTRRFPAYKKRARHLLQQLPPNSKSE
jgi:hypothetical protein